VVPFGLPLTAEARPSRGFTGHQVNVFGFHSGGTDASARSLDMSGRFGCRPVPIRWG